MREVDGNGWKLFKSGIPPKKFFEKPEVKESLKSIVERKEMERLVNRVVELQKQHLAEATEWLRQSRLRPDAAKQEVTGQESPLSVKAKVKYGLLTNQPVALVKSYLHQ